tara:strand:+ start:4735 stop:6825 length:2091 start_codon:yes stop_codon:yes gene_type:complete
MRTTELKNISLILIIAILFFFFFLGFNFSNPNNSDWLTTFDLNSYQDAWNFFKNDKWRFPLGSLPNYGNNIGNSIVYADIIPLFAIFFKLFKKFITFNFQYYSIWIFISIFLQAYLSFKIINKFTNDNIYSSIGAIFFIFTPVFLNRLGIHIALASHWLILLSIYIETCTNNKNLYRNLNIILSLTIHFSLTIIIIIFHYIFKIEQVFLRNNKISFIIDSLILGITSIIIMYIIGYFEIPPYDGLGGGYGYFALNLNSFFNPLNSINGLNNSWSIFFPILDSPKGHYEGFAYLGLSGILFFTLFLYSFFSKKNGFFFSRKILIILSLTFLVLAITNKIYFSEKLIFSFKLHDYIYGILGIIRASGRMIWPIYYLIFFTGIIFVFRNVNFQKSKLILILLLIIQIIDLSPGLKTFYSGNIYEVNNNLKNDIWDILPKHYENVKVLEKKNDSALYRMMPNYLGKNFKKSDIFNAARLDRSKMKEGIYQTIKEFSEKNILKNSFYVTIYKQHFLYMKSIFENDENYYFYFRDGIWILTNKLVINQNQTESKKYDELKPKNLEFGNKIILEYNLNDGYQGVGWIKSLSGIRSVGYLSSLMFSIDQKKCSKNNYLNFYFNLDDKVHKKKGFKINVLVNKSNQKKVNLNNINKDYFSINIDCKSQNYLIEFEMIDQVLLKKKRKTLNADMIGFELRSIELIN